METIVNKIDETTHNVLIKCGKEEFDRLYNAELAKAQQKVEIKGFRKGKVPLSMVKQRFGQEIFHDICFEFSNTEFTKYAHEDKLHIAGSPYLKDIKTEDDGVTCVLEYEIHPEVDLVDLSTLEIDEPVYVIEDEDIDTFVDKIRMEFGSTEDAELASDEYHSVTIEITEIEKSSGNPTKEPFTIPDLKLTDRAIAAPLRERLQNVKVGDEFDFDASLINADRINEIMHIKVISIKKLILGELTEEIITKISNGRFDTIEDLREDVGLNLQESLNSLTQRALVNNLRLKIVEKYADLPLPKNHINEILNDYLTSDAKRRKIDPAKIVRTEEVLAPLRQDIEKSYIWSLVTALIQEKENLQLEDDDVIEAFGSMGLPPEMANIEFLKSVDKDGQATRQMLDKKLMDFMLSAVSTNNVTVDNETKLFALANLNYKLNQGIEDNNLDEDYDGEFNDYDMDKDELIGNDHIGHVHGEDCDHNH